MKWFWLRRHRRIPLAGGLPHGSAGRLAWRKAARPILYAGLGVVLAGAAAGCTGSPGSTGQGRAATAASPSPVFISRTVPDAPVGGQVTWFLRAVADVPWSPQLIRAHFDAGFLAQLSPADINSDTASLAEEVPTSGASLIGVLWQDPARYPYSLLAVASFGGQQMTVNIAVDMAGLISGLQLSAYQPAPGSWAQADRDLAGLAPDASLLAARVSPGGVCTPVHQVAAAAARPLASMFKLFVLGALAHQIAAGRVSWDQDLTVTGALKSAGEVGPGYLQYVPAGTRVPVWQTATQMISISDNTAADMLIHLVGRSAVQAQDRQWSAHAALNVPFLTTRELFLLKYVDPGLADQYLRLAPGQRAAFLASAVDSLPLSQAQLQNLPYALPADIDTLEWFASPNDICRAFAGLQQLAAQPALAQLGSVLSANNGGIGLDPAQWPTIWFKGGSEPGVLTLGYLGTNNKGQTFVVVAMLSDPAAVLSSSAVTGLLAIVQGAFELLR
ncbi:MAG TPA: serine hydrolase [Streptosporangiaceae bacterium]